MTILNAQCLSLPFGISEKLRRQKTGDVCHLLKPLATTIRQNSFKVALSKGE